MLHVQGWAEPTPARGFFTPRSHARNERRDILRVPRVGLRETAADVRPVALDGPSINGGPESGYHEQKRPGGGDREACGNQEAPEIGRVAGMCVGPRHRKLLVFRDMT